MGPRWAHRVLQVAQVGTYIPFIIYKGAHMALELHHRVLEGAHVGTHDLIVDPSEPTGS